VCVCAQVALYKYVFPPNNKHATLCTIGLIQPTGGIMPLSELQARWAARVFSGKVRRWGTRARVCVGMCVPVSVCFGACVRKCTSVCSIVCLHVHVCV
jgi:hypothetical protein